MKKPTIYFAPDAWARVCALVRECDDEIGWHGLAEPVKDDDGKFVGVWVREIFVPKQTVSGATVDVADDAAFEYMDDLTKRGLQDSAKFIRYWGHSHVNMGVSPSSVDTKFWNDALNKNGKPEFYASTIHNKKGEAYGRLTFWFPEYGLFEEDANVVLGIPGSMLKWAAETVKAKLSKETFKTYVGRAYDSDDDEAWKEYFKSPVYKGTTYDGRSYGFDSDKKDDEKPKLKAVPKEPEKPSIKDVADDDVPFIDATNCDDAYVRLALAAEELGEMTTLQEAESNALGTYTEQKAWARKNSDDLQHMLNVEYGSCDPDKLYSCDSCGSVGGVMFDADFGGYLCDDCMAGFGAELKSEAEEAAASGEDE